MGTENEGKITCPRTKNNFNMDEAEKVYVM